jgi:hypothetical protein
MRNVSDEICRENQNTHFMFSNFLSIVFENRAVYEIMWKNIGEPARPQMTIWRVRIACWIPKATNTHSGYATLRYTYITYDCFRIRYDMIYLTLSNPIFLPTAYSPVLFVLGGKEVGGLLVIILQF